MAKSKTPSYFYRAQFKPDSLDVFEGFGKGFDGSGRALGYLQAHHRRNWSGSPYGVVNDFICSELGRFVRLPIPPCAITYAGVDGKRVPTFSSLDFNFSRARLPAVIPEFCVQHLGPLCAAVLAFDIWVANEDRHDENLHVDSVAHPREMHVYDHDQALFGGSKLVGPERLDALRNRLGVSGGTVTGGNQHVFLRALTTHVDLYRSAERIGSVPEWLIDDVCLESRRCGLDAKLANKAAEFLKKRADSLIRIIQDHQDQFTGITDWPSQRHLA